MNSFERSKTFLSVFFNIVIIVFLVFIITSIILSFLISGKVFSAIGIYLNESDHFRILQLISIVGVFGLSPIIVSKFLKIKVITVFQLNKSINVKAALTILLVFIISIPFLQWLIIANQKLVLPEFMSTFETWIKNMESKMAEQTELLLTMNNFKDLLLNIFIVALVPAFFEEFFFRGMIQTYLIEWLKKPHLAIILTSIFFSAVHFQFYGFFPRMMLGIMLGYILFYSHSLWGAILFHFINNFFSILLIYFQKNNLINTNFEINMSQSYVLVILSLGLLSALIFYFAFYYDKKRDKSKDWIKVFETSNEKEAEIVQGKLENEGIHCTLLNKRDSSFVSFGVIEVFVQPENVELAKKIIDEEINLE